MENLKLFDKKVIGGAIMSDTLRRWKDATEDIRGDFEDLRRVIRGEEMLEGIQIEKFTVRKKARRIFFIILLMCLGSLALKFWVR